MENQAAFFEFLCRIGDNTLVLGHQISAWCGHAPVLEEDIALANTALDLIGQTQMWLGLAGDTEGKGRSADDLAMLRDAWEFRNVLLVEQPNGDFGQTMMRQFLFDCFHHLLLQSLAESMDERVSAIASKAVKEVSYHKDRSSDTVIGLGDGTEESRARMQKALDLLWPYVGEMFESDAVDVAMAEAGIALDLADLRSVYNKSIARALSDATLKIPDGGFCHSGGKTGLRHSEHLGHLLAQMQWLQRAYPGAVW